MRFGQLAVSESVNKFIYRCLKVLPDRDQRAIVKKFTTEPSGRLEKTHALRELALGAYITSHGYAVRYEYDIDGKKPDWSILDADGKLSCMVDAMTLHHPDLKQIVKALRKGAPWVQGHPDQSDRIYSRVHEKIARYAKLANTHACAFVVALFLDFVLDVDVGDVAQALLDPDTNVFHSYPSVSGVVVFCDDCHAYHVDYLRNRNANRGFNVSAGSLLLK